MPPRRKRIRSDDSENSTVDSRGPSSGSDIQKSINGRNSRHPSKKVTSEDYDGDCELEQPGKNRITRTATRSRVLKQKSINRTESDNSCSTPVTPMEVDGGCDLLGFEKLMTPFSALSPVAGHLVSTPQSMTPRFMNQPRVEPVVIATPKPLFETPLEKPVKKFKRKRIAKYRLRVPQNRTKDITEDEALMIAHFNEIDGHELQIE